jgi:hypothetical protein
VPLESQEEEEEPLREFGSRPKLCFSNGMRSAWLILVYTMVTHML